MLSDMRRTLCTLLLPLCFASGTAGQGTWSLPRLRELDQSNAIRRGKAQLLPLELNLIRQLTHQVVSTCVAEPFPGDARTADGIFNEVRVSRVKVTPGGDSVLVVQGYGFCMCGGVGNCPFWFISEGPTPTLLLAATGIQKFALQKRQALTPFDLVLGTHESAMAMDLQRFQFDGSRYRRVACATVEWSDFMGNKLVPPRLTKGRCP